MNPFTLGKISLGLKKLHKEFWHYNYNKERPQDVALYGIFFLIKHVLQMIIL